MSNKNSNGKMKMGWYRILALGLALLMVAGVVFAVLYNVIPRA